MKMELAQAYKQGLVELGDEVEFAGCTYKVVIGSKHSNFPKLHAVGSGRNPGVWISSRAEIEVPTIVEGSISATKLDVGKPDGGPSAYYDFPFKDWTTVNDMVEYLSNKQWGSRSWIFKDILKAVTRWGSKDGTTFEYDSKKIIYYGARLLMSVSSKETLRKYLQQLLDDKQFQ